MQLFNKLENKFGAGSIFNLTYYLIGGQILAFLFIYTNPSLYGALSLQGRLVFAGQWWRLLTFLFLPLSMDIIFAAFTFYLYYLYGTALEKKWGSFRYLVYILVSYFGTIALSLLFPDNPFSNVYIYTSVFLAFAYLYPEFRLYLFFIIPVKVKWMAWIAWTGIILSILFGGLAGKMMALVSVINFLLFFGPDLVKALRLVSRHGIHKTGEALHLQKARHICAVCGKNEIDNPDMQIRYCKICIPETCYCGEHAIDHPHKR